MRPQLLFHLAITLVLVIGPFDFMAHVDAQVKASVPVKADDRPVKNVQPIVNKRPIVNSPAAKTSHPKIQASARLNATGQTKTKNSSSANSRSRNSPPADIPNWDIVWYDDFDGTSLDTNLWHAVTSGNPTNNSLHAYLPQQVSVENGFLVLTSENEPALGRAYRSGLVQSTNVQQYGRIEVSAKLPTSRGMWPAIWLLPNTAMYPWPSEGEIDIMENRGDEPNMVSSAFHWGTNPPFSHSFVENSQQSITGAGLANYHNSFHTYVVEWEADIIRYYIDGVHHFTVTDDHTANFLASQSAPMNLVINTAIGGDFLNNPDATTVWPQRFEVDYVRVYERAEADFVQSFENGSFEANGGGMGAWTTFGNRTNPNCTTTTEFASDGSEALKVYGQFNGATNYSGLTQGISVQGGESLRAAIDVLVPSNDTIAGTNNSLDFKIDYFSKRDAAFGSSHYLGSATIKVASNNTTNNQWQRHVLTDVAPSNAVEARVAIVFIQQNNAPGSVLLDNVWFWVEPAPTVPLARKMLDGVVVGGQTSDLGSSDNQYLQIDPTPTSNPFKQKVDMILLAETPLTEVNAMAIVLEASMSGGPAGDVIQTLEAWDRANSVWELFDTRAVANSDVSTFVEIPSEATRFIHPITGEILLRAAWESSSFSGATFFWSVDVDLANLQIQE